MVVATLCHGNICSLHKSKLTSSCIRKCLAPSIVLTREARNQRHKPSVMNVLKHKYSLQTKRIFMFLNTIYVKVKIKCKYCMESSMFVPVHISQSKASLSNVARLLVSNSSKAVLQRLKQPRQNQVLLKDCKEVEQPLVYFASSHLELSESCDEDYRLPEFGGGGHNKDKSGQKNPEKGNMEPSDLSDEREGRPHSQYDILIEKVKEENSQTSSLLSSVKQFVEMPANTFFSFISQKNFLEGSESTVKMSSDEGNGILKPPEVKEPKESQLSLLDSLYQFIPYLSSTGPLDDGEKLKQIKVDEEEKEAVRIQSQKDKIARKIEINNRTRYLIQSIRDANSLTTVCENLEDLKNHLLKYPDTRITAVKENAIREITHIYRTTFDKDIFPSLRMTLALLGSVDPPKQRGIRVLCIDGGGCRGVLSVEIFRRLSELSGKNIHEMFDYICGVSTGAILAFLLGIKKLPVADIESIYRQLGSEVFNQSRLEGTRKLVTAHAYYNSETLEKILKTVFGNRLLIETAADEDTPKCCAVSTLVNRMMLKPFVWRNYSIVPGTRLTHWPGTCRGKLWEALRASSAAPGYFEEFKKHSNIHQDGGLLTNNPAGVAMNECSLLWPNAPIQCVVSVGTGRYEPTVGPTSEQFLSLKDKLLKVVDSATSVSEVHTVMYDLLPDATYFRFNPFIREPLQLDDFQEEKLNLMVEDAREYIERNDHKFRACVGALGSGHKVFAR